MVGLDLFERVVNHAAALQDNADRAVSTAHLKADKRRRPARAARCATAQPYRPLSHTLA